MHLEVNTQLVFPCVYHTGKHHAGDEAAEEDEAVEQPAAGDEAADPNGSADAAAGHDESAEQPAGDGDEAAEELFMCHEECGLHRMDSLCTLCGDELTEFADRVAMNISCNSVSTDSAGTECFFDSDEGYTY